MPRHHNKKTTSTKPRGSIALHPEKHAVPVSESAYVRLTHDGHQAVVPATLAPLVEQLWKAAIFCWYPHLASDERQVLFRVTLPQFVRFRKAVETHLPQAAAILECLTVAWSSNTRLGSDSGEVAFPIRYLPGVTNGLRKYNRAARSKRTITITAVAWDARTQRWQATSSRKKAND